MAVILNASTSSGFIQTADTSGVLTIQNNGTNALSLTSGNLQFNSGYGSVATAYGCRAWVNFNGTTNVGGFCTIRASGGVTSVADRGAGAYTVNFTTAMPDANYSALGTASRSGAETQLVVSISTAVPPTINGVAIQTYRSSDAGVEDSPNVNVSVFR
jgi:hypothetical protein